MNRTLRAALMASALSVSPAVLADPPVEPERIDAAGFQDVIASAGQLYVSGQPSEEGLAWAREQGVTTVVNLRTQREMDDRERVPYDEAATAEALGLDYVHIPLGGDDTPYTPEALARFGEAVDRAAGKVLLHCTVGRRASHMYAAWLVRRHGLPLDEATRMARKVNFGTLPIEGLLGESLTLTPES